MKVLVFGLVWVQKACSAPKWSNESATYDDLTGYESGFCWMDCDWYDDPLYYSHLDYELFLMDPIMENQEGFEDSDDRGTYLDSGSGASRSIVFSDPGTGLDRGIRDPTDDKEPLDGTGLPPWKKLAFGLVVGLVLVGILWKWLLDFVDRALEIPSRMERPPSEPEFQVVRKARADCIRNLEVVLGTEQLCRSRFFHLLVRRMADIGRELVVPNPVLDLENEGILERMESEREGRAIARRSISALERISAAVLTPMVLESAPRILHHQLKNNSKRMEVIGQPDKGATQKCVLELPPPEGHFGIPPEKEQDKTKPLFTDGKTATATIEKTPPAARHPWNFPRQPTVSAVDEVPVHGESPSDDLKNIIGWKPKIGRPSKSTGQVPIRGTPVDFSGKTFRDEGEKDRSLTGSFLPETTKERKMMCGLEGFKISGTSRVQSGPPKTWKILCCLHPQNERYKSRKKAKKKKYWMIKIFKFKC